MKSPVNKGFTLIELMVVVVIITILTGIVMSNLTDSKKKARDAKRIADLAQIQLAEELFFDRCNSYTPNIDSNSLTYACPTNPNVVFGNYLSKIPSDPLPNSQVYQYFTSGATPTDYVLRATLETNSSALQDSISGSSVNPGNVNCDHTNSPYYYCVKPK